MCAPVVVATLSAVMTLSPQTELKWCSESLEVGFDFCSIRAMHHSLSQGSSLPQVKNSGFKLKKTDIRKQFQISFFHLLFFVVV